MTQSENVIKSETEENVEATPDAEIAEDSRDTATPFADESIKADAAETSAVGPTALLKAEKANSSSNESFEHLDPAEAEEEAEQEPVSVNEQMPETKEPPQQGETHILRVSSYF